MFTEGISAATRGRANKTRADFELKRGEVQGCFPAQINRQEEGGRTGKEKGNQHTQGSDNNTTAAMKRLPLCFAVMKENVSV